MRSTIESLLLLLLPNLNLYRFTCGNLDFQAGLFSGLLSRLMVSRTFGVEGEARCRVLEVGGAQEARVGWAAPRGFKLCPACPERADDG